MKKIAIIIIIVLVLSLVGCSSSNDCDAVKIIKNGNFYFKAKLDENNEIIFAQKDGIVTLEIDSIVLLLSKDEAYSIDKVSKTYSQYSSLDLNYNTLFTTNRHLKLLEVREDGDEAIYTYSRSSSLFRKDAKNVYFVYKDSVLTEICFEQYYDINEKPLIVEMPVIEFSEVIPKDIVFVIPNDYKFVDTYEVY